MSDMQVSVRLRWETGVNLISVFLIFQVFFNNAVNEIGLCHYIFLRIYN